jgi:hypothetical protein
MLDFTRLLGAVAMACTFAAGAWAQDYPRKPITIVSSAAPGGGVPNLSPAPARYSTTAGCFHSSARARPTSRVTASRPRGSVRPSSV